MIEARTMVEDGAPSFMGLPAIPLDAVAAGDVAVLGIPLATPYASTGAHSAKAPAAVRRVMARYADALDRYDFDLGGLLIPGGGRRAVDCGDLPFDPSDFPSNRARITRAVKTCLDRCSVPVVIGGDDSVAIPVLAAYAGERQFTIVQIDAHIDWRHELGGETMGLSSTMRRASEMTHVGRIVQVGQRATGSARPQDVADARAYGVEFVSAAEIHRDGPGRVFDSVPKDSPVFVHVDIDVLDPSIAPGVSSRSPGGLMFQQVLAILHGVAAIAPIVGFAAVELVPDFDDRDLTALTTGRLLANAIGLLSRQHPAGR